MAGGLDTATSTCSLLGQLLAGQLIGGTKHSAVYLLCSRGGRGQQQLNSSPGHSVLRQRMLT